MTDELEILQRLSGLCSSEAVHLEPLHGGCVGEVYRAELSDGSRVVVKAAGGDGSLQTEGFMLRYLAAHSSLPVPRVIHEAPDLLIMEFVEGESRFTEGAQRHAAELLAGLHGVRGPSFGFERDTLIGSLPQPNPPAWSWREFFRDHRLLHMSREAHRAGRLSAALLARAEEVAGRIHNILDEPEYPSLIHGDVWSGNVLACGDRVTAFLDPAIYFGHPEIELAFITLFSTFGPEFFARYSHLRPIRPGFFEVRRHVYNLYPLLVHVRLFGGGYVAQFSDSLDAILARA